MGAQRIDENMLLHCYREHVADLSVITENDVYVGFSGVMGGMVLSLTGWIAYLWAEFGNVSWEMLWSVRELAFGSVGLGVPLMLVGVIAGLMGVRNLGRVAHAGSIMCLAGLVVFGFAYPTQWNVVGATDYSALGMTIYGLGLGLVVFRLGGAVSCRLYD
jgi:hypothetical protein